MKAAVTGASGFVGSHLVELLLSEGYDVLAMDKRKGSNLVEVDGDIRWALGDIRDESYVRRWLSAEVELVFHLAAVVGVSNYMSNPLDVLDINVLGTRNVLTAGSDSNARVVLASTSEVFGKNPKIPWSERDDRVLGSTAVDRWSYSTSKAVGEHLAFALHRQRGLQVTVVRYFNAYGPRQVPNYIISRAVHRVLNGLPPVMYDGGQQTRCFTFVRDAVAGTLASAGPAAVGEDFNLGSQVETTVKDATMMILDEAGSSLGWSDLRTETAFGDSYQDIDRRVPDASKAEELLGWKAGTELREGIRATIEWAKAHPSWLSTPEPMTDSAPATNVSAGEVP